MNIDANFIKEILKNFVQLTVFVFVIKEALVFSKDFKKKINYTFEVWKEFTFKKLLLIIPLGFITFYISSLLNKIEFLSYGWTYLIFNKNKSILFSSLDLENINVYSISGTLSICILFLFLIPHFAYYEEFIFRNKTINLKSRIKKSILFGLVHCLMGISLGTGFALAIPGFLYSYIYAKSFKKSKIIDVLKKEEAALKKAVIYHTMMNTILFVLIIFCLFFLLYIKLL